MDKSFLEARFDDKWKSQEAWPKSEQGLWRFVPLVSIVLFTLLGSTWVLLSTAPIGIGGGYTKSLSHVYYGGAVIQTLEPWRFVYLGGKYAKGSARVYYDGSSFPYADPKTFEYVGGAFAKDATHVFFRYPDKDHVVLADVKTFRDRHLGANQGRSPSPR